MNIGFWFDYDQTWTFTRIFNKLREKNPELSVSGFVINDRYLADARKDLPAGACLIPFYDVLKTAMHRQPSDEEARDFRLYDEKNFLSRTAYNDRHILKFDHDTLVRILCNLRIVFLEYIRKENIQVFIFNCIASQYSRLLWELLREAGVRIIIPTHFGLENLFWLGDNPFQSCHDIWDEFHQLEAGTARAVQKEEKEWAVTYMRTVRGGTPAYNNLAVAMEQEKFRFPSPSRAIGYLARYLRYYRNDITLPTPVDRVKKIVSLRINRKKCWKFFSDYDSFSSRQFIYYPLHYEPELATLVLSQNDQSSLLDFLARQLPVTWTLVVKEHPVMIGQRDWRFYKTMRQRYPNLLFADPGIPSSTLIRQSRCVLTQSGTATLEALLSGKPAVFTSAARFGGFDLGVFNQDINHLAESIQQACSRTISEDSLCHMLVAIQRHCFRFSFAEPLGNPAVLEDGNIALVADAIRQTIPLHR